MSNQLTQIACNISSLFKGEERDQRVSDALIELQFSNDERSVVVPLPIDRFANCEPHDVNAYSIMIHSSLRQDPWLSGQILNPIQMDTIKEMVSAVETFASRAPDSKYVEE